MNAKGLVGSRLSTKMPGKHIPCVESSALPEHDIGSRAAPDSAFAQQGFVMINTNAQGMCFGHVDTIIYNDGQMSCMELSDL